MRIARVIGTLTLHRQLTSLKPGQYLIAQALDAPALAGHRQGKARQSPMPESLVVFDHLGASVGQLIAVSEGAEATAPFAPAKVPYDAYNAAILDDIQFPLDSSSVLS